MLALLRRRGLLSEERIELLPQRRLAALRIESTRRLARTPTKPLAKLLGDVAALETAAAEASVALDRKREVYRKAGLYARAQLESEIETLAAALAEQQREIDALVERAWDDFGWVAA